MSLDSHIQFDAALPSYQRLQGKVAVVTGGGQGIGQGIALALAAEGAHIAIAEINPDTAAQTAQKVAALGVRATPYAVDVGDHGAVARMVGQIAGEFGQIDILIGNAGVNERVDLLDISPEQWRRLMHTNLEGLFFTMQAVARHMIAQARPERRCNGKIVNLSSVTGRRGRANAPQYAASKAAVISVTQAAALRLAPHRINVNALCPGLVITPMWEAIDRAETTDNGWPRGEALRRRVADKVPLGRAATVRDVAGVAVFLCTAEADYLTGQAINVDGGYEMN
jgi:NAD(P)-dependent dehydrogenase (short-subunit alcohol dehydrogenase family)